jgi:flagellar basal body-associated protein FliL
MDFNNQYQIPTEPAGTSHKKAIVLIIIGVILIALCGYVLWAMNSQPTEDHAAHTATSTAQTDDIDTLDQEAAAFDTTELDADLEANISSELGS